MTELRQAAACLRVFGDDATPCEISQLLGATPSKSWKKGELWSNNGAGQLRDTGGWILNGRWDVFENINDQIVDLLQMLTCNRQVWLDLAERSHIDMYCGLFLDGRSGSSSLCPDTLAHLAARRVVLNLEVYEREAGRGLMSSPLPHR